MTLMPGRVRGIFARSRICGLLPLFATTCCGVLAAPPRIGVESALVKVRPASSPPQVQAAEISAARNEFEAFQIVVHGGDSGVTGVAATASDLAGPGGARIPAAEIMLYREGLYNATYASNAEGATGLWPDPLIPAVDAYTKEVRNAFPFDVPPNESRAIWVEVFVPLKTPAGSYQGTVAVTGAGLAPVDVPMRLQVWGFDLPSTASLKSTFGINWDGGCLVHLGSYNNCGEEGIANYLAMYSRAALDHRISLGGATYGGDRNDNWAFFDRFFGPQLDGKAKTRLPEARLTVVGFNENDTGKLRGWRDHFARKGWSGRLIQYTCDEPPQGCSFTSIPEKAAPARGVGVKTLVTTDIDQINEHGLAGVVDVAVPVVNNMYPYDGSLRRPDYDAFLALSPAKEVWMYQSCMSHGCAPTNDPVFTGWPSYVIDASGIQNRAMEWFSFQYGVTGELYYQTTEQLATAWESQWGFDGNGDGTLFYPGKPALIGGSSHIPIESVRMKLIREGMEDYEYLHLLCELGDCDWAKSQAKALFPLPYRVTSVAPEALYATRTRLAERIESILAQVLPPLIDPGGVVNIATYTAPVSPGSVAAIFGRNLAPGLTVAGPAPLPEALAGVTVRMNDVLAPLFVVSPQQINVQVPWELTGAVAASVVLATAGGVAGAPQTVTLAPYAPAVLSVNSQGNGQAWAFTATGEVAAPIGALPGISSRPARRGEVVTLLCAGLGAVKDPPASGATAADSPRSTSLVFPTATLGGLPAAVQWAGLAPDTVGMHRVDVIVPADVTPSDSVPFVMTVNGLISNLVTIAVAED